MVFIYKDLLNTCYQYQCGFLIPLDKLLWNAIHVAMISLSPDDNPENNVVSQLIHPQGICPNLETANQTYRTILLVQNLRHFGEQLAILQ